jgi:tRNA threonylcarbamoyladenosine biosynthesis protein TsaE
MNHYHTNLTHEDIENLARQTADTLSKGDILLLSGELGSGKTYFTIYLCQQLGVQSIVNSPSYVLLNEYHGKYQIFHYDLYRLSVPQDTFELGIIDRLSEGITIIEWPLLIQDYLPKKRIEIMFEHAGDKRNVRIKSIT